MLTLPLVDFCFVLISLFHCDEKFLGLLHLETVISFVLKYVLCGWFFSLLLPFSFFMVRHQPFVVLTSCISSLIFMLFSAIFHLCLYLERKFNFYLQAPLSCILLFVSTVIFKFQEFLFMFWIPLIAFFTCFQDAVSFFNFEDFWVFLLLVQWLLSSGSFCGWVGHTLQRRLLVSGPPVCGLEIEWEPRLGTSACSVLKGPVTCPSKPSSRIWNSLGKHF